DPRVQPGTLLGQSQQHSAAADLDVVRVGAECDEVGCTATQAEVEGQHQIATISGAETGRVGGAGSLCDSWYACASGVQTAPRRLRGRCISSSRLPSLSRFIR